MITIGLLANTAPILLLEDTWAFTASIGKAAPKHPSLLPLVPLHDACRVVLLSRSANDPLTAVVATCDPGFVGPEDFVPLLFSPVKVLLGL